jgi:recombination protein RecA
MLIDMQRSGEVQVGVLDSVAALSPIKEQESDMEDTTRMGIPQQLMGEYCRKFQASNNRLSREGKTPFTILAINQLREKIGAYGDPEYTPGGRAKGFTATIDLRLRRGDWIQEGKGESKEIVGQTVKYKIDKNKTFKRMQTGEFDFYFAKNASGIPVGYNDNCKEVIMCGIEWGVIERAGAWFKYNGEKYQGLAELISALKADPKLVDILRREVLDLAIKVGRG